MVGNLIRDYFSRVFFDNKSLLVIYNANILGENHSHLAVGDSETLYNACGFR